MEDGTTMKETIVKSGTNNTVVKTTGVLANIKQFIAKDDVKSRFRDILHKNPGTFLGSIVSLVSGSTNFDGIDPNTIMMGAMQAATLDLPINPNLGFAYIIPYKGKAQFQMGWKGFVQLALRTGDYKTINTTEIYEGELISRDRLSGIIVIDEEQKTSEKIIGYVAFFSLKNGFEKSLYMSVEELAKHGKKFSKSYNSPLGGWKTNEHAMMLKTVLKLLLSKYGILSVQMQDAIRSDQAVVTGEGEDGSLTYEYVDSNGDTETKQLEQPEKEKEQEPTSEAAPPEFFINQISQVSTTKQVEKILKDKAVQSLGAGDKSKVDIAGMQKIKEIGK